MFEGLSLEDPGMMFAVVAGALGFITLAGLIAYVVLGSDRARLK